MISPKIELQNITKQYGSKGKILTALNEVFLTINPGETLGLVGESGCGKSTLGKILLRLEDPTSGRILLNGNDISVLSHHEMRQFRRQLQIVFQDPFSSLNPRMRVKDILSEPLTIHGLCKGDLRQHRLTSLLDMVELNAGFLEVYPHELSGGQRQRVAIARALAVEPRFIVLDEPLSALDVTVQSQIIHLFKHLKKVFGLGYLLISHDLDAIRALSDRIAVMYLGQIVEIGTNEEIYNNPKHPYTRALLSAAPIADPILERSRERIVLTGDLPSPLNRSKGCAFHPRCSFATDICRTVEPKLQVIGVIGKKDHQASCHNRTNF